MREDGRRGGGERMKLRGRDQHHARGLGGPVAALERRAKGDRHFTEDLPGRARADDTLDPVDHLGDLDVAGKHHEQSALVALVHGVLARGEPHVARGLRQAGQVRASDRSQEGNGKEVVD